MTIGKEGWVRWRALRGTEEGEVVLDAEYLVVRVKMALGARLQRPSCDLEGRFLNSNWSLRTPEGGGDG